MAAPITVGEFAAVQFLGPSPAEIGIVLGMVGSGDFALSIGADASTLAAMTAPFTLAMQVFQGGGDIRVQRGSIVAGPSNDLPVIRVPTSFGTVYKVVKPPGGWVQIQQKVAGSTFNLAAWVWEHPTENAQ